MTNLYTIPIVITISVGLVWLMTKFQQTQKLLVEELKRCKLTELQHREEVVKFIKSELEKYIQQIRQKKEFRSVCFVSVKNETSDFKEIESTPKDFRIIEVRLGNLKCIQSHIVRFTLDWDSIPGYSYTLELNDSIVHDKRSVLISLLKALQLAEAKIELIHLVE